MALVAYSDESDMSEDEESSTPSNGAAKNGDTKQPSIFGGIDSIVDEDEDLDNFVTPNQSNIISSRVSLSSIPKAKGVVTPIATLTSEDDELTDVPTKDTMKYNEEVCHLSILMSFLMKRVKAQLSNEVS